MTPHAVLGHPDRTAENPSTAFAFFEMLVPRAALAVAGALFVTWLIPNLPPVFSSPGYLALLFTFISVETEARRAAWERTAPWFRQLYRMVWSAAIAICMFAVVPGDVPALAQTLLARATLFAIAGFAVYASVYRTSANAGSVPATQRRAAKSGVLFGRRARERFVFLDDIHRNDSRF